MTARLNALKVFAHVFDINVSAPELEGAEGLRLTTYRSGRRYRVRYRMDAVLVPYLAKMPAPDNDPVGEVDVLALLAKSWGYEDCGYLRQLSQVKFAIHELQLGFILHAQYKVPVGEG